MDDIMAIARKHDLSVIEDAHARWERPYGHTSRWHRTIGCFSFHPRKVITTGEGGMVTTNRAELGGADQEPAQSWSGPA
jgi:dTDP-4-amino-4,6-dideoxygalactose transaminase